MEAFCLRPEAVLAIKPQKSVWPRHFAGDSEPCPRKVGTDRRAVRAAARLWMSIASKCCLPVRLLPSRGSATILSADQTFPFRGKWVKRSQLWKLSRVLLSGPDGSLGQRALNLRPPRMVAEWQRGPASIILCQNYQELVSSP
jgi:hypothetical protein